MSIAEKLTTVAENVPLVYKAGQTSEYDRFWDKFQNNGNATNYYYAFAYYRFNDENFKPKYDIVGDKSNNSLQNAFYNSKITEINVNIIPNSYHLGALFAEAKNLKTVRKIIVTEGVTTYTNTFLNCNALENITFEGAIAGSLNMKYSPKLTRGSLESVINHLSDNVSNVTLTLSKTAVDNAFKTSEGVANGSTSVEWAELIADKTNWTISLL